MQRSRDLKRLNINSKKVAVIVPTNSFFGKEIEVEKLAEKINQFGNILNYRINKKSDYTTVIFSLDEDYNKYADIPQGPTTSNISGNEVTQEDLNNSTGVMKDNVKYTLSDDKNIQNMPDGTKAIKVVDNNTQKEIMLQLDDSTQILK